MFSPSTVHTPLPGVRIVEPSSSVYAPVPITAPIVGTPTTLPRPSALKPAGNISASDAERSFSITRPADHFVVAGMERQPPRRAAAGGHDKDVVVAVAVGRERDPF